MNDAELDAAGISDPGLRRDYLITGRVLARHGRGLERIRYMFPTPKRPYMDALWTFIGYLDDLADEPSQSAEIRLLRLAEWQRAFERHRNDEPARDRTNLSTGEVDDEATARAFVHMMRTWNLPLERVSDYIDAQRRAIHTTEYRTYEDLLDYVENITLLPSLWMNTLYETSSPESEALCRQAVTAFKLMDFIWDVPEDLETGHLYLPL
ncbi:squalene/phytoene synthase family protein [Nocardia huaxiensis]|uniref:Squalene/phytoene synthase family protein n=3 Tax=Nocardia huaxiensis TaxID=2755382 RepID=A0A7D6VF50_9NOCA|nr:squalene/phytoene synthase family protein [Nocardia huaxiensis]QLY33573.1 squalene/phytoene synthase family protein [Nocardia huaxiensis]